MLGLLYYPYMFVYFFVCFLKVMLKCDFQILSIKFLRNVNLFISFKYHLTETLSGDIE